MKIPSANLSIVNALSANISVFLFHSLDVSVGFLYILTSFIDFN